LDGGSETLVVARSSQQSTERRDSFGQKSPRVDFPK
jgi:hypothetical protein